MGLNIKTDLQRFSDCKYNCLDINMSIVNFTNEKKKFLTQLLPSIEGVMIDKQGVKYQLVLSTMCDTSLESLRQAE